VNADEIIEVFEASFRATRLRGGYEEPFYSPASETQPATIRFKEDFAASALHEVAHWCIAGRHRRMLPDFGYWYEPERDGETQTRFETVEAPPQALEWIFSVAAARSFRVSFDNFDLPADRRDAFRRRVHRTVRDRLAAGLPVRAQTFADALAARSGSADFLHPRHY